MPVKSFREAKHRLAGVLEDRRRRQLAEALGAHVLAQRGTAPAYVACDDDEVANWAVEENATVLWTPGLGLAGAVNASVHYLGKKGFSLVVVAHADIPFVTDLDRFGEEGSVTLAPDHHLDGTNIAAVPANSGFRFSYGPRSYLRHQQEAKRRGLPCHSVFDWRLATDIDLPSDLALIKDLPLFTTLLEETRASTY